MLLDECRMKGLIRKEIPNIEKARKSIDVAKRKLALAERLLGLGIFEEVATNSYAVMFHAARALLFKDGFIEKSHYALFIYIKERYSDRLEPRFINEFNALRIERHAINYGLEESDVGKDEAGQVVKIASQFLSAVGKMIC